MTACSQTGPRVGPAELNGGIQGSLEAPLAIPDIAEKYSHLLVSVLLCGNPL